MTDSATIDGAIMIIIGAYLYLIGIGYIPRQPKDVARVHQFRQQHGRKVTLLGSVVFMVGLVWLLRSVL